MQVGFHIARIGGGDAVPSAGQEFVNFRSQVKQDAFIDKGHNGFISSVERKLSVFGRGEMPKNYILVIAERLENAFASVSGGIVSDLLDEVLQYSHGHTHDETGRGYEECEAEYVPVLVCELGYSESFKQWYWGSKEQPTGQPQNPVCVLTREQFEKCRESINNLHK